jgi:glycerophosphoryl diester phosphodiesterase
MLCATANAASAQDMYVIAHMANTRGAVDWAAQQGANAVEIDLRFDDDGAESAFRHGGVCDCICAPGTDSICSPLGQGRGWRAACQASSPPAPLLDHIAARTEIALVIIDSKVGDLAERAGRTAGQRVIRLIEDHLFGKDYTGNVIISAAQLSSSAYLRAAADAARGKSFADKVFFSFDQEGNKVREVLTALRDLPSKARAFGTGASACLPGPFRKAIRTADHNRRSGSASFVYVWTLDRRRSMARFLEAGAQGIITNYPLRLQRAIKDRGGRFASRSTTIPLSTSDDISGQD